MDRKTISRPLSEMGIKEPGLSPDFVSFQDINRALSLLSNSFTERRRQTLVSTSLVEKSSVEDRRNYYLQVASSIMETKKNFLQAYESINRNIESTIMHIVSCAKAREQELKAQLWSIGVEKVVKWEQQLAICSEAVKFLESRDSMSWQGSFFPESNWNVNLSTHLNFVDAGEVKFDPQNYEEIIQILQSMGEITCHKNTDLDAGTLRSIVPKFTFGGSGNQAGQFCRPWGVCSDVTGRILVCDRSNHRIQIFNECGEFILQFGKEGTKPGEFNRPSGIDVDEQWRIIVADKDNHRIQIFTYSGHFLFEFGSQGTKPSQFMYPWDVATNKNCDIAVSDSKNHRVQLFNCRGYLLTYIDAKKIRIENPRFALQFLDSPRGLSFRPDGELLVTDFNNHRVFLINKTFTRVKFFGCEGSSVGKFFRPQGIACDKSGKFAVADCKNYRVQVFDNDGKFLKSFGSQGSDPGQFDCPQGICFHPNKSIIVVDFNNNRVQVF